MTKLSDLAWAPIDPQYVIQMPKQWLWKPQEDITAYETALCLPVLICADGFQRDKMIASMPENFARHFEEIVK